MEVLNPRTAFLSNAEVLSFLQELDATALAQSTYVSQPANLRQVTTETRAYLTSPKAGVSEQTSASVQHLVRSLGAFDLTRPEKLQISNLMPTTTVVLYTIIEDFELRFPEDSANGILALVKEAQTMAASEIAATRPPPAATAAGAPEPAVAAAASGAVSGAAAVNGTGTGTEGLFLPDDELGEEDAEGDDDMDDEGPEIEWADDAQGPEDEEYADLDEDDGD